MQALFVGQTYIDVTFLADEIPTGDEKAVARDYAVSFGGNAVTAAFACARLGIVPDLLTSVADDWLGRMFIDMAAKYGISVHQRKVAESSLSFIMPHGGKRAIVRCRDDHYLHPIPPLNIEGSRALHLDGHQPDAAIHYAKIFREAGILTSLDGGGLHTPVIRDAELKSLSEISNEMRDLAARARSKRLAPHEYQGGSTTISNLGMYGIDRFDAVINPPQASILAVGRGEKRAVVKDDALKIATMMSVTLLVDHRVIDGALGAELLAAFKAHIEDPVTMLV